MVLLGGTDRPPFPSLLASSGDLRNDFLAVVHIPALLGSASLRKTLIPCPPPNVVSSIASPFTPRYGVHEFSVLPALVLKLRRFHSPSGRRMTVS